MSRSFFKMITLLLMTAVVSGYAEVVEKQVTIVNYSNGPKKVVVETPKRMSRFSDSSFKITDFYKTSIYVPGAKNATAGRKSANIHAYCQKNAAELYMVTLRNKSVTTIELTSWGETKGVYCIINTAGNLDKCSTME